MTFTVDIRGSLSPPTTAFVYPFGSAYFDYQCSRYNLVDAEGGDDSEDEKEHLSESDIVIDVKYIKSLDSKDWKDQDHYRVLGIPNLRVKASTKDVKKAYKYMVLKCHPDKSQGNTKVDEEAFTCIQKAYEQLCVIDGKRAYDSVDPEFDDDVPNVTEHNKQNFYKTFGIIIENNAQWSMNKNVPTLGTELDEIDYVNDFYNFWYDFKSWREYSYLDEEERDKADCKEERRYLDKLNKQERIRRKKEEMTRMRQLVDNCYACDPRIKAFNEDRKKRKVEAKLAKQEAYKQEQEALRLQKEEEERIRQEEEQKRIQLEKEKADAEKVERQKQNKLLKGERKKVRDCVKNNNYFCTKDDNIVKAMENLDLLLQALTIDDFKKLNAINKNVDQFTKLYNSFMTSHLEAQETKTKENLVKAKQSQDLHKDQSISSDKFSAQDIALLVKAVKIHPPGTVNRWNTIAEYLNHHSAVCSSYVSKDIIQKVKNLQSREGDDLKSKANEQAYNNFENSQKSRIGDGVNAVGGLSTKDTMNSGLIDDKKDKEKKKKLAWSAEEQKLLEEGLKKFPQSVGPQRWDNIAKLVGTRSKKDCMRRYKDLVEQIKAKKAKQ